MTLDEINKALTACIDKSGAFTGPDTLFGSATLKAAFDRSLPASQLVIEGAKLSQTASAVVLTGAGQGPFAGTTVTATFTPQGNDVGLVASGTSTGSWTFGGAFPALATSILNGLEAESGVTLVLRTLSDGTHPPGLAFQGPVGVGGPIAQMAKFIGADPALSFAGPIALTFNAPSFTLQAPISQLLNLGPLNDLGLTASLNSVPAPAIDPTGPSYGANGAIALDTYVPIPINGATAKLPASMVFSGGPVVALTVGAPNGSGVTIADLAQYALGGAIDGLMPPKDIIDFTGAIALNAITFAIAPLTPALIGVTFELAATKDWSIGSKFTVSGLNLTLDVSVAGGTSVHGVIAGTLQIGENGSVATLDAVASLPDCAFGASLDPNAPKPNISQLITYVAGDFGLPTIEVSALNFALTPSAGSFDFNLQAGFASDWSLDIGDFGLAVTSAWIELATGPSGTTGKVEGTLVLNQDNKFDLTYAVPGGFSMFAQVPKISLSDLIKALCKAIGATPPGFDFSLEDATILITKDGQLFGFSFGAQLDAYGSTVIVVQKGASGWGYAFGIALDTEKLASLPGLGVLSLIDDAFGLEEIVLVYTTLASSSFSFPPLAQFDNPSIKAPRIASPGWTTGLTPGLNLYAMLDPAKSEALGWLCKLVGFSGTVATSLQIPSDPAAAIVLSAMLSGSVNSNTGLSGKLLVKLLEGSLTLGLAGVIPTTIAKQSVTFTIEIDFQPNGVFISGSTPDTISFEVVELGALAIELGIDDEGIPSFGFAATIQVGTFNSSIAIFIDTSVPTQSLFAGSISDVTLDEVLGPIVGLVEGSVPPAIENLLKQVSLKGVESFTLPASLADSLNKRDPTPVIAAFATAGVTISSDPKVISILGSSKAGAWAVTDLSTLTHYHLSTSGGSIAGEKEAQVTCVPQTTQIGSLPPVTPRFQLSGELDVFGMTGIVDIDVVQSQGLAIEANLSPVHILNDQLLSITDANDKTKGPYLSLCSYQKDGKAPHADASAEVSLLGLTQSLNIQISESGASFQLSSTAVVYQYSISVVLNGSGFNASGSAQVGFDKTLDLGLLGSISIDTTIGGAVNVSVTGSQARAGFSGSFTFQGHSFSTGQVTLDVTRASLENLADELVSAAVTAIKNFLLSDLNPSQWLNWVKQNIIPDIAQDAKQVGQVLGSLYHQSADQIASETHQILGYGADAAAVALEAANFTADVATQALAAAGFTATEIADAIKNAFTNIHADTAIHIDTPGGFHTDTAIHLDTPAGPHADSAIPPHGDGGVHFDTPSGPHADTGGSHTDGSFIGIHGDTTWPHVDSTIPPHGDTRPHADTPSGPHADTHVPPHVDTPSGGHVDTQIPPHGDTKPHVDVKT